jgi:hypothetical protein
MNSGRNLKKFLNGVNRPCRLQRSYFPSMLDFGGMKTSIETVYLKEIARTRIYSVVIAYVEKRNSYVDFSEFSLEEGLPSLLLCLVADLAMPHRGQFVDHPPPWRKFSCGSAPSRVAA